MANKLKRKGLQILQVKSTTPYICMRKAVLILNELSRYHLLI